MLVSVGVPSPVAAEAGCTTVVNPAKTATASATARDSVPIRMSCLFLSGWTGSAQVGDERKVQLTDALQDQVRHLGRAVSREVRVVGDAVGGLGEVDLLR